MRTSLYMCVHRCTCAHIVVHVRVTVNDVILLDYSAVYVIKIDTFVQVLQYNIVKLRFKMFTCTTRMLLRVRLLPGKFLILCIVFLHDII